MFKYSIISVFFLICLNLNSSDFKKANEVIELRKSAMQGIWMRVKRLAPFIEFNEANDNAKLLNIGAIVA